MSGETLEREIGVVAGARVWPVRRFALTVLAAALLLGAAWYGFRWWTEFRFIETTDDAYVGGNVTPIAPHVSGFVAVILIADNAYVRAGQPLIRLDPRDFRAAVARAAAMLRARGADLVDLEARETLQEAMIRRAAAELVAREAQAVFAASDAKRYGVLAVQEAGSRQDAERAQAGTRSAAAGVNAARAGLVAARQELAALTAEAAAAQAQVAAAKAQLEQAQLNLGYTTITAPIDGYVGNRYAQVGAYVTAGTDLLSIVPARGLWVDANFKEDELSQMKPGDPAAIVADILPGLVFHGHVLSIAPATGAVFSVIPPQNATGNFTKIVQRVPVRIALDGRGSVLGPLRPGLSTTVSVVTRRWVGP